MPATIWLCFICATGWRGRHSPSGKQIAEPSHAQGAHGEARELMQALHPLLGLERPPANDRLCGTIGMDR